MGKKRTPNPKNKTSQTTRNWILKMTMFNEGYLSKVTKYYIQTCIQSCAHTRTHTENRTNRKWIKGEKRTGSLLLLKNGCKFKTQWIEFKINKSPPMMVTWYFSLSNDIIHQNEYLKSLRYLFFHVTYPLKVT